MVRRCLATAAALGAIVGAGRPMPAAPARARAPAVTSARELDSLARDGDLVFQCGNGAYPRLLAALAPGCERFCHVGIVVIQGGVTMVAHVEPGEGREEGRAKLEPMAQFVSRDRTCRAALYRPLGATAADCARASRTAARFAAEARPFDWDLDRSSGERLYCTELVWRAYAEAGCSLVRDRDLLVKNWKGKQRWIITPRSMLRSGAIGLVARYGR